MPFAAYFVFGFYMLLAPGLGFLLMPMLILHFFWLSAAGAFMVLLVVLNKVGPGMVNFAAHDIAVASWTWVALRSANLLEYI